MNLNPIKVAFIAGTLGMGGAEKQLIFYLKALKEKGIRTSVYSLRQEEYYEKDVIKLTDNFVFVGKYKNAFIRLLILFFLLRKDRPDIIQSVHSFTNIYAGICGRVLNIISIGAMRSSIYLSKRDYGWFFTPIIKFPSILLFNSIAATKEIEKEKFAKKDKIFLLQNVIELKPVDEKVHSAIFTFAFVGKLHSGKGVKDFIEAFHLLDKDILQHIKGVIIGEGSQEKPLKMQANNLPIEFLGSKSNIHNELLKADAFIFPSLSEGFPNVIIEAMNASLPVIATPAGDIPSIIKDSQSGFIIPFNTPNAIAEKMKELFLNKSKAIEMGKYGREIVKEKFNYTLLPNRIIELYKKISSSCKDEVLNKKLTQLD